MGERERRGMGERERATCRAGRALLAWCCVCGVGETKHAGESSLAAVGARPLGALGVHNSVPEVHTPVRLSADALREVVRLMARHNISEHVLPPPQSVVVSRRSGHVRRIVFEWPEPGPRGVPTLPVEIGPEKLSEADLARVLHALLRRYPLSVYIPDSDELVNTQVTGLSFSRATFRLRMRDDELISSDEAGGGGGG
eukprot:CAMPEP_0180102064 /NCGR_PEP_ID=MMETSP0985-20121206/29922_1 /TAXON_ID=483367 /ORGANISM="non described non described, Strain CCMP 2436" /LENGTH=197 /DNA_ID=CAMNT_0022038221 /DNA_START=80 /DNA_END=669 /DNA_ORIENTATION=+